MRTPDDNITAYIGTRLPHYVQHDHDHSRYIVALYSLIVEIDNGGLHQFLSNSSGDEFAHVVACFREFSLPEGVAWAEKLTADLGGAISADRDERNDQLEAFTDAQGWEYFEDDEAITSLYPAIETILKTLVQEQPDSSFSADSCWRIAGTSAYYAGNLRQYTAENWQEIDHFFELALRAEPTMARAWRDWGTAQLEQAKAVQKRDPAAAKALLAAGKDKLAKARALDPTI